MPDFLRKILDKDIIISTAPASQVINSPQAVEDYYKEIAATHMSLGETESFCKRIVNCIANNQGTFNGAVVGEYGFGKTSLLIHQWHYCIQEKVLAIPPYQWDSFEEHFKVVYSWVNYIIGRQSSSLADEFKGVFSKYIDPSIDARAKEWAESHGVSFDQAKRIITEEYKNGTINLDLSANDLMGFCREVSEFLQNNTEWQGLLVITDELQETITKLNRNIVFSYLFDITNHLVNGKGNYGFLWGFPSNTHADLGAVRADILNRLNSNKVFIRLRDLYDKQFPTYLWGKFCRVFKIDREKHPVVSEYALQSIGQVCDGDRRDLGNGPRSVISAFKAMVQYYLNTHNTYQVEDFVNDCFSGEIMLGEHSRFVMNIQNVLMQEGIREDDKKTIKVLGAFPSGIPLAVMDAYGLREQISSLIQHSGGLGRMVDRNISLYRLRVMRKDIEESEDSVLESELRQFYSDYSPDDVSKDTAHAMFDSILLKKVFIEFDGQGAFERWKDGPWGDHEYEHTCVLKGSFVSKYPEREVSIHTLFSKDMNASQPEDKTDLSFYFVFSEDDDSNKIIKIGYKSYQLNLSLNYQADQITLPKVNDIIPEEKHSPMLFLCLAAYLKKANIPNHEAPDRDHLVAILEDNIIYNVFNEELLDEIEGSEIEINNHGEHLIRDLFTFACEERFPEYITIMGGRAWDKKIQSYFNVLKQNSDGLSLMVKRGKEPLILSQDKTENKERIAALFNQRRSPFQAWLSDIECLVEYKFDSNESYFRFKTHPLEAYLIDCIDKQGIEKLLDGVLCKCLFMDTFFLKRILDKGYLHDEILQIIQIGQARRYFNFEPGKHIIYKKPEDKEEMKDSCQAFVSDVREQIDALEVFSEYATKREQLEEVENKIDSIETSEQAEELIQALKSIQSYNKYYASKEIEKLKLDVVDQKRQVIESLSNIEKLQQKWSLSQSSISGNSPWAEELQRIKINAGHEISGHKQKIVKVDNEIALLARIQPKNNAGVVKQFLEANDNFAAKKEKWKEIKVALSNTEKAIKFIEKWDGILKLRERVSLGYLKHEKIFDGSIKSQIDQVDKQVKTELYTNQNTTLENHEQYYNQYDDISTRLTDCIQSLRDDWLKMQKKYEKTISKITGRLPDWRLRWENPEQAYNDLYESVSNEIQREVKKLNDDLLSLDDDVLYTMEVLNHKKAIQNKKIDEKIKELLESTNQLITKDIRGAVDGDSRFDELIEVISNSLKGYSELNKEHRSIIKPMPVDDVREKIVLDLLEKNQALDLKKLIIDFQKHVGDIDLAQSRDEVLGLIKELFIKKQITLQAKKGKV